MLSNILRSSNTPFNMIISLNLTMTCALISCAIWFSQLERCSVTLLKFWALISRRSMNFWGKNSYVPPFSFSSKMGCQLDMFSFVFFAFREAGNLQNVCWRKDQSTLFCVICSPLMSDLYQTRRIHSWNKTNEKKGEKKFKLQRQKWYFLQSGIYVVIFPVVILLAQEETRCTHNCFELDIW